MTAVAKSTLATGETVFSKTFPPISRHTLALYCGGSGDHNPIHVDIDFAKKSGYPDVFAHGMLVMGYLSRALTEAVPQSAVRSYAVRFVAITPVGAAITCEGTIVERFEAEGDRLAKLALTARDAKGEVKLQGEAVVALNALKRAAS
jgi:acyl dehydratase